MTVRLVTLEGKFVRLVPLSLDHLEGLCAVGLDDDIWRWSVSQVRTRDEMRGYIEAALDQLRDGTALPFATLDASSGRAVGSTRFANIDAGNKRLEVGWTWLGKPWQRTPLNTEAKYLMLRHAFEALRYLRVEFKTDALNERSRRALLRIGATEEGTLRSHVVTASGRIRDSVYYSILDREWPRVKAVLEEKLSRRFPSAAEEERSSDELRAAVEEAPATLERAGSAGRIARDRRRLPGGFDLDDDRSRIDREAVHQFLSTQSYWALGRSRETVERLVAEASRVVGVYAGARQIGFARTVSDGMAFAYLADVYVLPEFRGRGLGLELVREAVENGPYADRRWLLHTLDAHALYAKLGFGPPSERLLERQGLSSSVAERASPAAPEVP